MTVWTRSVPLVIRAHFLFCKSLLRCSRDLRLIEFVLISILLFPGNCEIDVRHDRHHLLSLNFYHRTDYESSSLQLELHFSVTLITNFCISYTLFLDFIISIRILKILDRKRGTDTTTIRSTILICVCSCWMSSTTLFCTEWDEVCCSVSVPLEWAPRLPYLTPDYRRHRISWYYHDWSSLLRFWFSIALQTLTTQKHNHHSTKKPTLHQSKECSVLRNDLTLSHQHGLPNSSVEPFSPRRSWSGQTSPRTLSSWDLDDWISIWRLSRP